MLRVRLTEPADGEVGCREFAVYRVQPVFKVRAQSPREQVSIRRRFLRDRVPQRGQGLIGRHDSTQPRAACAALRYVIVKGQQLRRRQTPLKVGGEQPC